MPRAFIVTRRIDKTEQPWMEDHDHVDEGATVYEYDGHTYGCISAGGVAVTFEPNVEPFFQVPSDALKQV